ncbi:MAG: hypothetical protein KAJ40_00415 [Alphaproteobacteria bacterium]|nr:hypothetical protein [Alphaproteobacteria bacterium]
MFITLGHFGHRYSLLNKFILFNPTQISNLKVWYDASDTSTVTHVAGAVSQWDDKSGNDYHVSQSTGAYQPTYVNGQYLEFDAAHVGLSATHALGLTSLTVFGVQESLATSFYDSTIIAQGSDGQNWSLFGSGNHDTAPQFKTTISGSSNDGNFYTSIPLNEDHTITGMYDEVTGVVSGRVDGILRRSITRSGQLDTDNSLLQVGKRASPHHRLREIIVYDGALSDSDFNQVGNYLADKWGTPWTDI